MTKRWRQEHPEQNRTYWRKSGRKFREKRYEYTRQYRIDHRDEILAQRREFMRKRYADNPEHVRRLAREAYARNPEPAKLDAAKRRAQQLDAPGCYTAEDVREQFARQRGRCHWCGEKVRGRRSRSTWHVDHVIPLALGGSNGPENLVVSCAACNLSKGAKLPHEFSDRLC